MVDEPDTADAAAKRILVVDDEPANLALMEALLVPLGYHVTTAVDGQDALAKVVSADPDLILLDIMMPRMNGYEAAEALKTDPDTAIIPIVMVTSLQDVDDRVKALESGADDFLTKPVDKTELRARVKSLLKIKAYNDHMRNYQGELEAEVARQTEELRLAFDRIRGASLETIVRLCRAAEAKDEDTGTHVQRMSRYAAAIAAQSGLDDERVEMILYAAPMHDVGKIAIPDRILLKPGKLDDEEFAIMRQHAEFGGLILEGSDTPFLQLGERIARTHHEKWDGSGYPNGLAGEEIPLEGRITAVADVFDALTSRRPYKEPFSVDESLRMIREASGSHFDPAIVEALLGARERVLAIMDEYSCDDAPGLESIFQGQA